MNQADSPASRARHAFEFSHRQDPEQALMAAEYEQIDEIMREDTNPKTASCPICDTEKDAVHKRIHHRIYNTRCEMNECKGGCTYDDDWDLLREPALDHCE